MPRTKKVKESEVFFKLHVIEEKSKFISIEGYFSLLLELYICDFCIYLPVFEVKLIF